MRADEKERYFICPNCGDLTTWSDILDDCSYGGQGLCDCTYILFEWDEKLDHPEPVYTREYIEYIEINKRWYDWLKSEKNHVMRLKMFEAIPKERRII